jgi:L-fuculose-phosphate aldolase
MKETEIRSQIVEICRRLYARNMLAAADGNVSYRFSDDHIVITPSGVAKGFIEPEQMAVIHLNGDVLHGNPSAERSMHLEVYRRCPQALAVVHAHPPHAVAWSLARPDLQDLPAEHLSEVILGAGQIPFVPYARPTTEAMGSVLSAYLPQCRAMILSRHGGLTWGEDLIEAWYGMERIEHSAQMLWLAQQLGGSKPLPAEEVAELKRMRREIGDRLL